MEPKDFYRNNIALMKYMYELTMNTWSAMNEYGEKMLELSVPPGEPTGVDTRRFLKEWVETGRKTREEFRKNTDQMFDRMTEAIK